MLFLTRFLAVTLGLAAGLAPVLASDPAPARTILWDDGWQFHRGASAAEQVESESPEDALKFNDWEKVMLPHTARIEAFNVQYPFQGFCWYRKIFTPSAEMKAKRVTLEFEAGMHTADIWVDGQHRLTHEGGYLPFTLDLTGDAARSRPVEVLVRLDNRDNPDVPPGKPMGGLDFQYAGGLYRDVLLHVTDPLHITDPVAADEVAGGGVFARYENVSDASATVQVATDVQNDGTSPRQAAVVTTILDAGRQEVATVTSDTVPLGPGEEHSFDQMLPVAQPLLWSTNQPNLYTLVSQVMENGKAIDTTEQSIGIRTLRTDPKLGFFLNGTHLVPSGANRHQAYPYIGNALPDNAQYRDARKLKEGGFDIIRLSHYPQDPAFLDACDRLGLLAIVCIPGWQFFNDTEHFKQNVEQNLRDTIRRDRNHPSCILWETSLNETDGHDDFFRHLVEVAHQEYPGDQMLTCGDTEGHNYDAIRYDVPYSGWDQTTRSRPSRAHGDMSLHREYGDEQYGGYSRYTRGDGEELMLVQAWNDQTALNAQNELPYTWGQLIWEAIDNTRGMSPDVATCGALDQFRLPKFLYYFYQSQRDPRQTSPLCDLGPMAFIANDWTAKSPRTVVVYSNGDEVELFLNGRSIGRQKPDHGPDTAFGDGTGFNLNYWQAGASIPTDVRQKSVTSPILTGGNSRALAHPPFTFQNVDFEPGDLKAVAYLDGKPVATFVRRTPGRPVRLALTADEAGRKLTANGTDLVFVHASVLDRNGTVVPGAQPLVKFSVEGPGLIVGDTSRPAEAGIASILLRGTATPGAITLSAQAEGLEIGRLIVHSTAP